MSEDGYDHPSARYRAMTFNGPEAMAAAEKTVTAAMDKTFGIKRYTTTESGVLVGAQNGNGEVSQKGPRSSPAWRQRIDKARREIQEHKTECRIRVAASEIQQQQIENDIREIKLWQNSLLLQSAAG